MGDLTHDYARQAADYAKRSIHGSDYIVFRELPDLLTRRRVAGKTLDLGCGAGRSTRFLRSLGLPTIGAEPATAMLAEARRLDPAGDYRAIARGRLPFDDAVFGFVFTSWVVLELPTLAELRAFLAESARVLRRGGTLIVVTNTPEFYAGRWVSCEVDFPENAPPLRSGQPVKVRLMPEGVELIDTFWSDDDYRAAFDAAGLKVEETLRPFGQAGDPVAWRDESRLSPYVIYVAGMPD